MGAITCTPILKAWVQGKGYLVLILRRSRQSGSRPDRLAKYMCFSYVSIIVYFLSAVVAHAPSMLLNTLHIGHDTI